MSSLGPAFLITLLVVLTVTLTSGSRTTRWPRPQSTKKPPRNGSGSLARTTTTSTSASDMHTDQTTDLMTDAYSVSPPDSTTYSSDAYPTDYRTDALPVPGNTHGNYTIDYSECYLNICECCPPERGPAGPLGERGLPGPAGERGPRGEKKFIYIYIYMYTHTDKRLSYPA